MGFRHVGNLGVLLVIAACSSDSPLERAVHAATAGMQPGLRIAYFRLANNALIENVTVRKAEGSWVLVTADGKSDLPYWINFSEVLVFRARESDAEVKRVPASSAAQARPNPVLPRVQSLAELADLIDKVSIPTPGGKAWRDLGDLQRREWLDQLTTQAPDVLYPALMLVDSVRVRDGWLVVSARTDQRFAPVVRLRGAKPKAFQPAGCPEPLDWELPILWNECILPMATRPAVEVVQAGTMFSYWQRLRPRFSLHEGGDRIEATLEVIPYQEL